MGTALEYSPKSVRQVSGNRKRANARCLSSVSAKQFRLAGILRAVHGSKGSIWSSILAGMAKILPKASDTDKAGGYDRTRFGARFLSIQILPAVGGVEVVC